MILLASTENKITKDKNGEILLHLEITEVLLILSTIVNNDYQQDSINLYQINRLVPVRSFSHKSYLSKNIQLRTSNH